MKKTNRIKRQRSLTVKLPMMFVVSTVLLMIFVMSAVFLRFRDRIIEDYSRMGEGVTNLMAMEVDPDRTDEYIEENFSSEEYNRVLDRLYDLKNNYPDVLYMYVYRITYDGGVVVFDLDSEEGVHDADKPGSLYELDEAFIYYIDDLVAGRQTPAMTGDTEDGYLLTDSKGNYQCHVCVDFSVDQIHRKDIRFVSGTMLMLLAAVLLILVIDIYNIQHWVSRPLNRMKTTTDKFSYETEQDHENNIRLMEQLGIHTGDEIEDIYHIFISFMKNNLLYIKRLNKAYSDILEKDAAIGQISQKAYRDPLTGAGSKAAYDKAAEALDRSGQPFAVAVFDINNLKYVNDSFGHNAGDSYIRGCCGVLAEVIGLDRLYRVGGDEFAALFPGGDDESVGRLIKQIDERFEESFMRTDREPF